MTGTCDRCHRKCKTFRIPWTGDHLCKDCIDQDSELQQMFAVVVEGAGGGGDLACAVREVGVGINLCGIVGEVIDHLHHSALFILDLFRIVRDGIVVEIDLDVDVGLRDHVFPQHHTFAGNDAPHDRALAESESSVDVSAVQFATVVHGHGAAFDDQVGHLGSAIMIQFCSQFGSARLIVCGKPDTINVFIIPCIDGDVIADYGPARLDDDVPGLAAEAHDQIAAADIAVLDLSSCIAEGAAVISIRTVGCERGVVALLQSAPFYDDGGGFALPRNAAAVDSKLPADQATGGAAEVILIVGIPYIV